MTFDKTPGRFINKSISPKFIQGVSKVYPKFIQGGVLLTQGVLQRMVDIAASISIRAVRFVYVLQLQPNLFEAYVGKALPGGARFAD